MERNVPFVILRQGPRYNIVWPSYRAIPANGRRAVNKARREEGMLKAVLEVDGAKIGGFTGAHPFSSSAAGVASSADINTDVKFHTCSWPTRLQERISFRDNNHILPSVTV